ncbi:MAG: sarcosine oxidase delta subunit SoxD [Rhodobacteraceae bacterium HLUCCA08]|nr:MAG: sarcosine oxidase delta subunit SoxD [Rhodobacteraceae bacterium HLUCCA08]
MLTLHCPYCGVHCDETELAPGGEAHLTRHGPGSDDADFESYLFLRENPRGVHFERWRHAYGCGKWFHAARCTVTLEVFGTYPAQTTAPMQAILDIIDEKRPGWRWRDVT